jgi:hypothetical protein
MISKELLSEVLKVNVFSIKIENDTIYFDMELPLIQSINLHKFLYELCDKWAIENKCYINDIYNEFWWDKIEKEYFADIPNKNKSFYADSRVEARVKAYEWILKEIND